MHTIFTYKKLLHLHRNFQAWLDVLEHLAVEEVISYSVFKFNTHLLSHIKYIIERNSTLRSNSLRVMERNIGKLKRIIKSRVQVGENINNILQRQALLHFIRNTKMISFESAKERDSRPYKESSFMYHPRISDENRDIMAQLWAPIVNDVYIDEQSEYLCEASLKKLVSTEKFVTALRACKRRMFSSSDRVSNIQVNLDQRINIAGKLWQNDTILTSSYAKSKQSTNKLNLRGGEFVRFSSFHTTRTR